MRSPRSLAAGLGALCLFTFACTDGVGRLELSDAWLEAADGGYADGPVDPPATPPMDAAMPTTQPKDAGSNRPKPPSQSECEKLEASWSREADKDAEKLLELLDYVRAQATNVCDSPPYPPLRRNAKLECSARLATSNERTQTRQDFSPTVDIVYGRNRDLTNRLDRAEFSESEAVFELVITNANSVENFASSIASHHRDAVCRTALGAPVQLAGAARKGHVWVVDFAMPHPTSPGGPRGP